VVSLCVGCHRNAEFGGIPAPRLREAIGENGESVVDS